MERALATGEGEGEGGRAGPEGTAGQDIRQPPVGGGGRREGLGVREGDEDCPNRCKLPFLCSPPPFRLFGVTQCMRSFDELSAALVPTSCMPPPPEGCAG